MNGHASASRVRGRDDEDENDGEDRQRHFNDGTSGDSKRTVLTSTYEESPNLSHYDIYVIPSTASTSMCPPSPTSHFQSAAFVVVNRASGLSTGLGIAYFLTAADNSTTISTGLNRPAHQLQTTRDAGFFLARSPSHDANKAVLLGWVEESMLPTFDAIICGQPLPALQLDTISSSKDYNREWLLWAGSLLEREGILSNPEFLLGDLMDLR